MIGEVASDRARIVVPLEEQFQTDHRLQARAAGIAALPVDISEQIIEHCGPSSGNSSRQLNAILRGRWALMLRTGCSVVRRERELLTGAVDDEVRAEPADLNVGAVLAKAVDTLVPGRRNNIGGFTMSGWLTHDRRGAMVLARGGSCCGSLRESFSGW